MGSLQASAGINLRRQARSSRQDNWKSAQYSFANVVNLKTITGKEKEATTKTNLALHPEYMNLLRQVEQLQMANEELRVQNLELTEENKNLRMGFQSSRVERHNGQTLSARNQRS